MPKKKEEESELEEEVEEESSEEPQNQTINPNELTEFLQPSTEDSPVTLGEINSMPENIPQENKTNMEEQLSELTPIPTIRESNEPNYLPQQENTETNYDSAPREQDWGSGGTISIQTQSTPIERLSTSTHQEIERTITSPGSSTVWTGTPQSEEKYFARAEKTPVEELGKESIHDLSRKEIKYRPKSY